MSQNLLRLAICVALASMPSYASVAVGTCQPQLTHFTTINAAVTAVPSGTTIMVCPGSYPEQVVINKNLTLKGVPFGGSSAAIITAPAGGIAVNSTSLASGGAIAAQILVDGASAVTISNMIVDGSNNGIATCGTDLVGVYYRNSSGTVTKNTVLNQALSSELNGCQSGLGIFV
jgi:pectin methylesterase-like acyl-CoA thioesterase